MVLQESNVKLMEVFSGICMSRFPQYFTKAMLLGDWQVTLPKSGNFPKDSGINLELDIGAIFDTNIKLCEVG